MASRQPRKKPEQVPIPGVNRPARPWERQPDEPEQAYSMFLAYRDMGPSRTIRKVAHDLGIAPAASGQLCTRHNWAERCRAWDAHVQRIYDTEIEAQVRAEGERRGKALAALLGVSVEALQQLRESMPELVPQGKVSLGQIAQAIKVACEGQRLEAGQTTASIGITEMPYRDEVAEWCRQHGIEFPGAEDQDDHEDEE